MAAPTTDIDICRKALRECHSMDALPANALTAPVGKAATLCSEFYDDARREVLRLASWSCVAKRIALCGTAWAALTTKALGDLVYGSLGVYQCTTAGKTGATAPTWPTTGTVADGTVVWTFLYAVTVLPGTNYTGYSYAAPLPADYIRQISVIDSSGEAVDFYYESYILYSEAINPILIYVPDSDDVNLWDPLLASAMVYYLASKIAFPLTGKTELEQKAGQSFAGVLAEATGKSKREKRPGPVPAEPWFDGIFPDQGNT